MDDYEYVIKQIFDRKKNNNNYEIKNSTLKSITSLHSEENLFPSNNDTLNNPKIKSIKDNKSNNYNNEDIKEINLTTDINNELNDSQLDIKNLNDEKIIKMLNNIKMTKEGKFIMDSNNELSNQDLFNTKNHNLKLKNEENLKNKNTFPLNSNKIDINQKNNYNKDINIYKKDNNNNDNNKKENKNNNNNENPFNEILSYTQKSKSKKENKIHLSNPLTERLTKENQSINRKIRNKIKNKFEKYNIENLMYEALKSYSQCKPGHKSFLDRMQFYAIKKQTEDEILTFMVEKSKPKIEEKERIKIFNHLIDDSNKRIENYNKIQQLKNKKNKSKIKFNETEFLQKYQKNIIDKLKEKENTLQLLRNAKLQSEKEKEELIIKDMKKRVKKASKEKIDEISNRLYAEAISFNARKKMMRSFSEYNNKFSNNNLNKKRNNSYLLKKKKIKNISFINPQNFTERQYSQKNIYQKYDFQNKKNTNNKLYLKDFILRNNNYNKKYIPIFSAEKMVDAFFKKNKK